MWRRQLLSVQGSWHLGQVQVGLSQARRLCRCSRIRVTLAEATHMQVPTLPGSTPFSSLTFACVQLSSAGPLGSLSTMHGVRSCHDSKRQ